MDYSTSSNPFSIEHSIQDFRENNSLFTNPQNNGFFGNGYFPVIHGVRSIEVINWENASRPKFGAKFELPNYWKYGDAEPRCVMAEPHRILVYKTVSGLIDIANLANIKYISEPILFESLFSFSSPIVHNDFIYCLGSLNFQETLAPITI